MDGLEASQSWKNTPLIADWLKRAIARVCESESRPASGSKLGPAMHAIHSSIKEYMGYRVSDPSIGRQLVDRTLNSSEDSTPFQIAESRHLINTMVSDDPILSSTCGVNKTQPL